MLYREQRQYLLQALEDMKRFHYLDPAGGDLSLRTDEGLILTTPTGSAFRRWNITEEDFVVMDLDGKIVERGAFLAPVETPLTLAIYKTFRDCKAIAHAHTPYASTFASLDRPVPSATNLMDTLGDVPCFYANDLEIKNKVRSGEIKVDIPEAMVRRPDVAAVFIRHAIPEMIKTFLPRAHELKTHGLAFVMFKHGVMAFARNIDEAIENLIRVEFSARVAIYQKTVLAAEKT